MMVLDYGRKEAWSNTSRSLGNRKYMKSQRNILSEASVVDSGAVEDSLRSAPVPLDIYLN